MSDLPDPTPLTDEKLHALERTAECVEQFTIGSDTILSLVREVRRLRAERKATLDREVLALVAEVRRLMDAKPESAHDAMIRLGFSLPSEAEQRDNLDREIGRGADPFAEEP